MIENSIKLEKEISALKKEIKELVEEIDRLEIRKRECYSKIDNLESELNKMKLEEEVNDFFRRTFRINSQEEARHGRYIVFDKNGNFVKVAICGIPDAEFIYAYGEDEEGTLEYWLKQNGLYAQPASSFCNPDIRWYRRTFKMMLKDFGWTFDKNGLLKDTSW